MQENAAEILSLIDGCKKRERKAQELLYRTMYGFAMNVAVRYARDEADAADIMSHAFVKIFKSISNYDSSKGSFYAWIKKIIIREGLEHIKGRNQFEEIEIEDAELPSVTNNTVEHISAKEIMLLLKQLPPATHAVFVLYVIDGYNHREIAAQLQISEGTSKWHLSEARKKMQKKLSVKI
ncbi:sigma-70 family RNA polymerase sigma factor [Lacibacter sp.]|uniref:RNA polymerase sigma factor n=1 Tax=Lacibacter sp. TaxID=1915409 RepID=UPI002B4B4F01|nr:sigma-70 family RNA polymerase sigma factor [Lacibacter sp.]HLP37040.1 sigma-70 family RNA polymerase sigma factor [Lacibacter sp.]